MTASNRDAGSSPGAGIESRANFERIRYANCWEDADVLVEALEPAPGKRLLSIASAGDNCLALAARGASVVAVDLSAAQLACLELRVAAIRRFGHGEVLGFLGFSEAKDRAARYSGLRGALSHGARRFWDANRKLIEHGVIHGGKFERFFHVFRRWVLPLIHSRGTVRRLMEDRDLSERIEFYRAEWDNWRWRALFRVFFGRRVMGWLGRDPEFFRFVEGDVAARILQRVRAGMTEVPTHSNPWLRYIVSGNFGPALPSYMRAENFEDVRKGCDRIELRQASVTDLLAEMGEPFDGANLSDIFEYLSADEGSGLYSALLRRCRSGARIAYWNMLVPHRCPEPCRNGVRELRELADALFARDRAFFYRAFVVEEAGADGGAAGASA